MKSRTTFTLLTITVSLAAFIYYKESGMEGTGERVVSSRRVFDVDTSALTRLEIQRGTDTLSAFVQEGQWMLRDPAGMRANPSVIERLLNNLETTRRNALISTDEMAARGQSYASFGLEKPVLRLRAGDESRSVEYHFGNPVPAGKGRYVRRADQSHLYVADTDILPLVPEDLRDARDRRVFDRHAGAVRRFEIARPTGFLQVQRNEAGRWWVQQPVRALADESAVMHLLEKLHTLRIENFVSDGSAVATGFGFDDSSTYVRVFYEQQSFPIKISLGRRVPGAEHLFYARIEGIETVLNVSSGFEELLRFELTVLRDRRLMTEPLSNIQRITLEKGGRPLVMRRLDEEKWEMSAPNAWPVWPQRIQQIYQRWAESHIVTFFDQAPIKGEAELRSRLLYTARFDLTVPPVVNGAPSSPDDAKSSLAFAVYQRVAEGHEVIIHSISQDLWYGVVPGYLQFLSHDPLFYRDHEILRVHRRDILSISGALPSGDFSIRRTSPESPWIVDQGIGVLLPGRVENLLDQVALLVARQLVGSEASDVARFGLDTPIASWTLGLTGETGIRKNIQIGARNEDGTAYGMVLGQNLVFMLESSTSEILLRPLVVLPEPTAPQPVPLNASDLPATNTIPKTIEESSPPPKESPLPPNPSPENNRADDAPVAGS